MWLGALSLPELLTAEGIPHALRIVGIMPVIYLAIGVGLNFILEKTKKEKYFPTVLSVFLFVSALFAYNKYFIKFPTMGESGEAYAEDMVGIANDINKADKSRRNILIVGEYGTKTIEFITHSTLNPYERIEVRDVEKLDFPGSNYKIFVQRDWGKNANQALDGKGIELTPVRSAIDGRVIYYEYQKD
jgi:hypothetical protein